MPVKKKRSYTSTLRQEQAAHTRARILDAAGALFEADGYARASIRAIAERAGVAADTVYATFGSKARVLTALIDNRMVPGGEHESVLETPGALAVKNESDQRRQIHLFAHSIANIGERVRPMFEIMKTASAVEPEMAAVYDEMQGYRHHNMATTAGWIAARGPLRCDLETAADIIWTLTGPDIAGMLRDGRGWTEQQYADWLEDTLVRTLLPDPSENR